MVPDGTPEPPRSALHYHALARPGARLPHLWLGESVSILDRLGPEFTLLTSDPDGAETLAAAMGGIGAAVEVLPLEEAQMRGYETRHVLVRPDGHVAWRGASCADATTVARRVTGHSPA